MFFLGKLEEILRISLVVLVRYCLRRVFFKIFKEVISKERVKNKR